MRNISSKINPIVLRKAKIVYKAKIVFNPSALRKAKIVILAFLSAIGLNYLHFVLKVNTILKLPLQPEALEHLTQKKAVITDSLSKRLNFQRCH